MSDVILVLNAGSSSLKFTLFAVGAEPSVLCGGQISGIGTAPRFEAKCVTASETLRWDKETWEGGTGPSREELLRFLLDWVHDRFPGTGCSPPVTASSMAAITSRGRSASTPTSG